MKKSMLLLVLVNLFLSSVLAVNQASPTRAVSTEMLKNYEAQGTELDVQMNQIRQTNSLRDAVGTLIDSSKNGYGLGVSETNPIAVNGSDVYMTYRQWDASGNSGVLGASLSTNNGVSWNTYSNLNASGAARYPSALVSENYPIALWNETGSGGGVAAGRAFYSFDAAGMNGGNYLAGMDVLDSPTIRDAWINKSRISYDLSGNMIINSFYTDWSTREKYHVRATASAPWNGAILSWGATESFINSAEFLGDEASNYTSEGCFDINEDGIGYFVMSAYWAVPSEVANHTIFIKRTTDFGETWSDWYHFSDASLNAYFGGVVTNPLSDGTSLPEDWTPFVAYDLSAIVDDNGGLHVFAGVAPSADGGVYTVWDESCGLYHFGVSNDAFLQGPGAIAANMNFISSMQNSWIYEKPGFSGNVWTSARDTNLDGYLYVVHHKMSDDGANGQYMDLFGSVSSDYGITWSEAVNITETQTNLLDETDPHIAPVASNGTVKIMYQIPDWDVPTIDPALVSEDYLNRIYFQEYTFDITQNNQPDLTSGSGCTDWGDALVLSPIAGEFTNDGGVEPFLPGDYYINSAIQNIGTTDAIFLDDQSAWKIFLDDVQVENWGWWTASRTVERASRDLEQQMSSYLGAGKESRSGRSVSDWVAQNSLGLESLAQSRSGVRSEQIFENNLNISRASSTRDLLLSEGFEVWPNGWTLNDEDGGGDGWFQSSAYAYDGSYSAAIDYNGTVNLFQGIKSPVLDLSSYAGQSLSLTFAERADFASFYVWHDVSIWIDGVLNTYYEVGAATTDWVNVSIDLSAFAGMTGVQIEFYYQGLDADDWFVDAVALNASDQPTEHVIGAGQCLLGFTATPTTLTVGTHELRLEVDPDGFIAESDESNNSYTRTITVEAGGNIYISEARQQAIGTTVSISGVVTSINFSSSGTEYSIQDATAGIILYYTGSMIDLNMGDQVLITGAIADYSGKLEIVPLVESDVSVTTTGVNLPTPVVLTIAELNTNGESFESQLIRINSASNEGSGNVWPTSGLDANVNIIDNTSEIGVLRIDKETDIDGSLEPIWPSDMIGIVSEFSGVYQILPRFYSDFIQSAPVLSHFQLVYSGNPYLAMNIYATSVTLEGMDLVTGDEVGIYDGEYCVGAGVVVGVIDPFLALVASTDDPGTPEIDGFTPGHPITYRLWDASEGAEISNVNSSYSLGNGLFTSQGTAMVDLAGMTQLDMNLALESGWNIMSFYANPDELNLLNVVQPLITNGSLLKIQDETGSAIENLPVIGWVNNIGDMSVSEGYYIKMAAASNLNLIGSPVELPFTLALNTGWNIMGYPLTSSQNALAAVQGLIDGGSLIKVQDETGAAIEELPVVGWINNIGDLTSGKGYYVKVSMDTDITLDNQPALARAAVKAVTPGTYFELLPSGNPYLAMNIYVMNVLLDEVALGAGTEIGVFDGDLCVGSAQLTQTLASELDYLPLVIGTDDPSTEEIDGFTVGHNVSFRIWTGEKEQTIAAVPALEGGTVAFTPQGSMVVNLIGATVPDSYTLYDCYPNPFNPSTTISYDLPLDSHVQLVIYDVLGREIRTLISRNERAGSKAVIWDGKDNYGRSVSSGIYPVRFQAGNYMKVKKALFIK